MKLDIPMFRYLVTTFKCRPKGVSSSGCMNLLLAFAIPKRVESGEESEMRREKFSMAYLGGRVLQVACALIPSCSDPTSDGQISVHTCHPWIGNAGTHSTSKDL